MTFDKSYDGIEDKVIHIRISPIFDLHPMNVVAFKVAFKGAEGFVKWLSPSFLGSREQLPQNLPEAA